MNKVGLKKHTLALLALTMTTATQTQTALADTMMNKNAGAKMNKQAGHGGMKKAAMEKSRVGLEGYCPVCVVAMKKWEKGNPQIAATFDGITYHFPSQAIKAKFEANPQMYVPALNGDCIVCYEKMGKRIPGNIHHAALHRKRLYLFPGAKEKAAFVKSASEYEESDLAVDGECVVCLAKMGKHVPGSARHTVLHNGLRYQFPSDSEAQMFRKSPAEFVAKTSKAMMQGHKTSQRMEKKPTVKVAGRSGCAGCEFGVTPLSAPDELGLAIVGNDGRITVVEDAHKKYPEIYKARFDGERLVAVGTVIKTQGHISWLRPSSLERLN